MITEESYCSPWDLKIQEERFKLLNEQQQRSLSSINQKTFQRTHSARTSSRKKSFTSRKQSPPVLPPLPAGGLLPPSHCTAEKANTDTSQSFLFTSKSPPHQRTQRNESVTIRPPVRNRSLPKTQTTYDQPWNVLQTSLIHNLHGRSLQKMSTTKPHCSSPTFPIVSSCQFSDDTTDIPIDRYL
jgi:hypothetical protein